MKNLILKAVALFTSAKVHATHTAIKGNKSGGTRDSSGQDWWSQSKPELGPFGPNFFISLNK